MPDGLIPEGFPNARCQHLLEPTPPAADDRGSATLERTGDRHAVFFGILERYIAGLTCEAAVLRLDLWAEATRNAAIAAIVDQGEDEARHWLVGMFSTLATSTACDPAALFDTINPTMVSVAITQSGAAPAELQTQVTKWVEDAIAGVRGVKHITSTITEGSSVTSVEFRLEVNTDRAVNDVKDAVSKMRINLPRTNDEPVISRVEIAGLPIVVYGVKAPTMTPADLS